MLIKMMGAVCIGIFLGSKGIVAIDRLNNKVDVPNLIVISVAVMIWTYFVIL
jgi:hypothetical protein